MSSALLLLLVVSVSHHIPASPSSSCCLNIENCGHLLLSEFYAAAVCSDEYLVISNQGPCPVDLRGWNISDGEGTISFDSGTLCRPGSDITIAFNTTSFVSAYGRFPEVSLDMPSPLSPAKITGRFALADAGDAIWLVSPQGAIVDAVCYGYTSAPPAGWSGEPLPAPGKGEVFRRISEGAALRDTDGARDWAHFREFRYGYTQLSPLECHLGPGSVTAFTSPDCSLEIVLAALDSAGVRVTVCVYELSSWPVTLALSRAITRGAEVRVLADGLPAGGIDAEGVACLSYLTQMGARVYVSMHNLSAGVPGHVMAMHAKYVVVDSRISIVMSENLVEQGVPTDEVHGNRGWGVMVQSSQVSVYLESIFEADTRLSRKDVVPWAQDPRYAPPAVPTEELTTDHLQGALRPLTTVFPAELMVYPSPDSSASEPYLLPWIAAASDVAAEQFQVDLMWENRWAGGKSLSPIIAALIDAEQRGARVRVLLDSAWYNKARNSEVIASVIENTSAVPDSSEYKLMDPRNPIGLLHNKGLVIDSRFTVVSSNNWVRASFARNRELALVVSSQEVAGYFEQAFELDWTPDVTPPVADAGPDVLAVVGEEVTLTSARCTDDRCVVSVFWDVGCDGTRDSENATVTLSSEWPRTIEVRLEVTDAWGNTATDSVLVTFSPNASGYASLSRQWTPPALWCVSAVGAVALLGLGVALRRRRRLRKLNHGRGC